MKAAGVNRATLQPRSGQRAERYSNACTRRCAWHFPVPGERGSRRCRSAQPRDRRKAAPADGFPAPPSSPPRTKRARTESSRSVAAPPCHSTGRNGNTRFRPWPFPASARRRTGLARGDGQTATPSARADNGTGSSTGNAMARHPPAPAACRLEQFLEQRLFFQGVDQLQGRHLLLALHQPHQAPLERSDMPLTLALSPDLAHLPPLASCGVGCQRSGTAVSIQPGLSPLAASLFRDRRRPPYRRAGYQTLPRIASRYSST